MTAAASYIVEPMDTSRAVAFASLVDLAKMQIGTPSAEICDACNTINTGHVRFCKCCSHKLQAFYAANDGTKGLGNTESRWPPIMDFAAFFAVINSLVIVTAYIPIR